MTRTTNAHGGLFKSVSLLCLLIAVLAVIAMPVGGQQERNHERQRMVNDAPKLSLSYDSANVSGQEVNDGDVVRVETQLVSVPTVVTDTTGRQLATLRAENFTLFEDGQKQTVANFGTTEAPFEIALLLDTSASTRDEVALIRQAATSFIDALRPGDRVAVVAFNTSQQNGKRRATVEVLSELTANRTALRSSIKNLGSSNGTPFYDALERIASEVFRERPLDEVRGRQAVIALTDGVDSTGETNFADAWAKLLRSGLACYFIQVDTEDFVEDRLLKDCQDDGVLRLSAKQLQRYRKTFVPHAQPDEYNYFCQIGQFERMQISRDLYSLARKEMNDLAKITGGKNFVVASLQDARAAFAQVATEIGTQYSLGYYPTNKAHDGQFRAIRVELRGVQGPAQVRAREGYYAPKEGTR